MHSIYFKLRRLQDTARFLIAVTVYILHYLIYMISCVFNYGLDKLLSKGSSASVKHARYGRIVWKRKLDMFLMSSPVDFVYLHLTRVDPEYVLKPNISLYCVTKYEAIFVETAEQINIYSSEESPFIFHAQFNRSKNIVRMPIEAFHALAERTGDPLLPTLVLSHTGRCGSTLLCQALESVPGTQVMSEPDATWNVYYLQQLGHVSAKEYDHLLKSTIRLLCKPRPGIERIVIKSRSQCASQMPDISNRFPKIKQMFMYRNCRETLSSWLGALAATPYTVVLRLCVDNETVFSKTHFFRKLFRHHLVCKLRRLPDIPVNTSAVGLFTHMWANHMIVARDAISRDQLIRSVKYEDVISKPLETCTLILQAMGIDLKHLKNAISTFSKDSQRGLSLSRSRIGNDPWRSISVVDRIKANDILSGYNLPKMGDNFTL